ALVLVLPGTSGPPTPPESGRVVVEADPAAVQRAAAERAAAERAAAERGEVAPEPVELVSIIGGYTAGVPRVQAPAHLLGPVPAAVRARCDIIGKDVFAGDQPNPESADCPQWVDDWASIAAPDPDVIVVSLGLRQLFDLNVDGTRIAVGTPAWEERYRAAIDEA